MVSPALLYTDLLSLVSSLGAFRLGIAGLDELTGLPTQPPDLLAHYRRGISLLARLDDTVVDGLLPEHNPHPGQPTPAYARLYDRANQRLDEMAQEVAQFLQGRGYPSEAIPASETLLGHRGALSHKAVARQAGLGWIGRHLLLIVPGAGPRVRLGTVLTAAPLPPTKPQSAPGPAVHRPADRPAAGDCGPCRLCIEACPIGAIRYTPYQDYPPRHQALDVAGCAAYLDRFAHDRAIGRSICGICMAVCPAERPPAGEADEETGGNRS